MSKGRQKFVIAIRDHQHATRVRYPEPEGAMLAASNDDCCRSVNDKHGPSQKFVVAVRDHQHAGHVRSPEWDAAIWLGVA